MNHFIASDKSKKGQYIVREGTSGDTFYIISDGDVKVTKKSSGKEEEIRTLTKGDYFGEQVSKSIVQCWQFAVQMSRRDKSSEECKYCLKFTRCKKLWFLCSMWWNEKNL